MNNDNNLHIDMHKVDDESITVINDVYVYCLLNQKISGE